MTSVIKVCVPVVVLHGQCHDLFPAFRRTCLNLKTPRPYRTTPLVISELGTDQLQQLSDGSRSIDVLGRFELSQLCAALEQSVGRRLWLRNRVCAMPHREDPSKLKTWES